MRKLNIFLISPLYSQSRRTPDFLKFLPDSLRRVASSAPGYNYIIIDENTEEIDFDYIGKLADIVGITVMTVQAPRAYQLGDKFREMGIPVVMGGIHVSFLSEEAIQHADAVVIGEAEGNWEKLLEDFKRGGKEALNQFYRAKKRPDLSKLPVLKRGLLDSKDYNFNATWTTRGCPHNCSFCSVTEFFGKKFRVRPIKQVIEEIKNMRETDEISWKWKFLGKLLGKTPKNVFAFLDDNIAGRIKYAEKLFKAFRPLNIIWGSQASVDMVKHEGLVELAAESGCKALFVGFESVNLASLDEIGKKVNKPSSGNSIESMYKRAIQVFHRYGILVVGAFIFGFDSDDKSIFKKIVEFARKVKLDLAQFTVVTPLVGTRLMEKLKKERRILTWDWSLYDFENVVFKPKKMTVDELAKGTEWAWKEFYSWKSIWQRRPPLSDWLRFLIYMGGNLSYRKGVQQRLKKSQARI